MEKSRLYCPVPSAISPHYRRARDESLRWLSDHEILSSEADFARLSGFGVPELVSRAYPDAEYRDLRLVIDWTLWSLATDDNHEKTVQEPKLRRARFAEHCGVLEHGGSDHGTGMNAALADIRHRVLGRSSVGCLRRFTVAVRAWFDSMTWESENQAESTRLTPGTYLNMREFTVGMHTKLALFDVTHQRTTSDSFWATVEVRRLMSMGASIVGFANDVFSYRKEKAEGNPHNLVLLLAKEHNMPLEDAVEYTIELHNLEMVRFLQLEEAVRAQPSSDPGSIADVLGLLRAWIRGNIDWAFSSSRYGLAQPLASANPRPPRALGSILASPPAAEDSASLAKPTESNERAFTASAPSRNILAAARIEHPQHLPE